MKHTSHILLLVFLMSFAATLWAQKGKQKDSKKQEASNTDSLKKLRYPRYKIPVYLGYSDIMGGLIPKQLFDSLLKQGIAARDSAGDIYQVDAFNFNYVERTLYEDSIGNLIVVPDYMLERCFGDTITTNISKSIYDRTKAGDTVYIDQILLMTPDSSSATGKTMKFEITK